MGFLSSLIGIRPVSKQRKQAPSVRDSARQVIVRQIMHQASKGMPSVSALAKSDSFLPKPKSQSKSFSFPPRSSPKPVIGPSRPRMNRMGRR